MDLLGRVIRVNHHALDLFRIEMEDAGFLVVDPDHGVEMVGSHEAESFQGGRSGPAARTPYPPIAAAIMRSINSPLFAAPRAVKAGPQTCAALPDRVGRPSIG
jgi:hypothetical protein